MSLLALKETITLLMRSPLLFIPGAITGVLAVIVWLVLIQAGTFFTSRLLILFLLVALFFIIGLLVAIKKNVVTLEGLFSDGISYYFKVLVPTLVIVFGILLIFIMVVLTLTLIGATPAAALLSFLVIAVILPTYILTFFYDTAAVFEGKKVFESLHRSIEVVTANLTEVILFFIGCIVIILSISFAFLVIWSAFLADRLEPITKFNETQLQSLSPNQLTMMIGTDGIWITTVLIFCWVTILIPFIYTYKACFYRLIVGGTTPIQQQMGEFDSKGRWYKY